VTTCVFIANRGGFGGAVRDISSSIVLANSLFEGNYSIGGSPGGALFSNASTAILGCTIVGNCSNVGGGLAFEVGSPVVRNTIVWGNSAGALGDQIFVAGASTPSYAYCDIQLSGGSSSWDTSLGTDAGGNIDGDPVFTGFPQAVVACGSPNTTTSITISSAATYVAVGDEIEIGNDGVLREVTSIAGDIVGFANDAIGSVPTYNTAVHNWGVGATSATANLQLESASPCLDAGSNSAVAADVSDLDGDLNTSESVPFDVSGGGRFVDDAAADTGLGTAPLVDIGAEER
jgi:hypothetical protein